eukprot:364957-Chlamydomonas_euryale.AAC.5
MLRSLASEKIRFALPSAFGGRVMPPSILEELLHFGALPVNGRRQELHTADEPHGLCPPREGVLLCVTRRPGRLTLRRRRPWARTPCRK